MNSQELEARAKAAEEGLGKLEERYRQQSEENRQRFKAFRKGGPLQWDTKLKPVNHPQEGSPMY